LCSFYPSKTTLLTSKLIIVVLCLSWNSSKTTIPTTNATLVVFRRSSANPILFLLNYPFTCSKKSHVKAIATKWAEGALTGFDEQVAYKSKKREPSGSLFICLI